MKLGTRWAVAVALLSAAGAAEAATIQVTGQDDALIDRAAIQAAVNGAAPGDVIVLGGTFQLDGTPVFLSTSDLTIEGVAVDDDGDGAINEDRPDGVDNDGDGLTDEDGWDAVLRGVDNGVGGPAGDAFPSRFNDGFEILGFDASIDDLAFRNLEFRRLNRAIYIFPDYADGGTVLLCGASSPRTGSVQRVSIRDNAFVNGRRGVEILGRVDAVAIRDNWFSNVVQRSVLLFGQTIGCAEPDGSIVQFLPLGTPRSVDIVSNEMSAVTIGLLSFISDKTTVRDNVIQAFNFAVASIEDKDMLVTRNDIRDAFFAILGTTDPRFAGPSKGNVISQNRIADAFIGVLVDCVATGYSAINNEFTGSFIADVLFDGTAPGGFCVGIGDSFGNTVVAAEHPNTVQDYGTDNKLLGSQVIDITTP